MSEKIMSKTMSKKQIASLRHEDKLPIGIIDNFCEYLNMETLTRTTPLNDIIQNQNLPWNKRVLSRRRDVQMRDAVLLKRVKWNFYYITLNEPDKCEIVKNPHYPWDKKALSKIDVRDFCDGHILGLLKQYPDIYWDLSKVSNIFTLKQIIDNPSIKWPSYIIRKYLNISPIDETFERAIQTLPKNLIDWEQLTVSMSWEIVLKYPSLPWKYQYKYVCNCGEKCHNHLPKWAYEKLKDKGIDWKNITRVESFETIYFQNELPWDTEVILERILEAPFWFIKQTNYEWDFKYLTKSSSWNTILNNPDIPWDIDTMALVEYNSLPPAGILIRYKNASWDWEKYSSEFSFEMIALYKTLPWDWSIISQRENIPFFFFALFYTNKLEPENVVCDAREKSSILALKQCEKIFPSEVAGLIFNNLC